MNLKDQRTLSCLSHWLPIVQEKTKKIPRTATIKIQTDYEWWHLVKVLDGEKVHLFDWLVEEIRREAQIIGFPVFLRTGMGSGKHNWKNTCYVATSDEIPQHVCNLIEWSECVDMFGLPYDVWAVRELLQVEPLGVCRSYGDMPVAKEFRLFVKDGKVLYVNNYWPYSALTEGAIDPPLTERNYIDFYTMSCTARSNLIRKVEQVMSDLPGNWSVDMLWAKRLDDVSFSWFLTDMAVAELSYGYSAVRFMDTL